MSSRAALLLPTLACLASCDGSLDRKTAELHTSTSLSRLRPIRVADGVATASLSASARTVTFDRLGPRIDTATGGDLAIELRSIGRSDDHLRRVPPATPALRPCSTDLRVHTGCGERLSYDRGAGLEEWWLARADGVQQGFVVQAPPEGERRLQLAVEVSGRVAVGPGGQHARIESPAGTTWLVGGLAAWDADGVALPVSLAPTDHNGANLLVEVDDTGARYPVTVDPVYTTPAQIWYGGYDPELGGLVTGGDFNGDGRDDVAASTTLSEGAVLVWHGKNAGLDSTLHTRIQTPIHADGPKALSGKGDLNGDGYDDLVVGRDSTFDTAPRIDVHYGTWFGIHPEPDVSLDASVAESETDFGRLLLSDIDLDRDGYDDILFMTDDASGDHALQALYGSASGVSTTAVSFGSLPHASITYGRLASAGDVDGNGYDDVLFDVTVVYADADGPDPSWTTDLPDGKYGVGAGDVNGDGYDDVLMMDATDDGGKGAAWLFEGGASGVSTTSTWTVTGANTSTRLGAAGASAGDTDGDGYDDILVSATGAGANDVYLYAGSASGLGSAARTHLSSTYTSANSSYGAALVGGLDLDGDGDPDLVISETGYNIDDGAVHTFLSDGAAAPTTSTSISGADDTHSRLNYRGALVGDVDGDGRADAVLSFEPGIARDDSIALFLGQDDGLLYAPDLELDNPTFGHTFGYSIAGVGDVDGDGLADVMANGSGSNEAYVFHGATSGLSTAPDTTLSFGSAGGDWVSGAGDVDGDGFDDVLVGATGSGVYGGAWLHLGSTTGVDTTTAVTFSAGASSSLGYPILGLGDVDGDGYDDIAIGDLDADSVYVYLGSTSGPSTTADQTLSESRGVYATFGYSVAAGDYDGDGLADLAVGEGYSSSTPTSYYVYQYYGTTTGLSATPSVELSGSGAYRYGLRLGSGDLDADGIDDLLVVSSDTVDVHLGTATGVASVASTALTSASYGTVGSGVSSGHDVDGDGYDDVLTYGSGAAMLFRGYSDADGDGVGTADDCDDTDGSVGAGTTEVWADVDGDGYGDPRRSRMVCSVPASGWVTDATDCDDHDAAVNPGATEVTGDGIDGDCDGAEVCYVDLDDDGYRPDATSTVVSTDFDCSEPGEALSTDPTGDCDDTDPDISPEGVEAPADGIDQDCDGTDTCVYDADDDGYIADVTVLVATADADCTDAYEADPSEPDGDCDDTDPATYPGATEVVGDEVDQDCDGGELCYEDRDNDGYRTDTTVVSANVNCASSREAAATDPDGDCDDTNATIHPWATETVGDEVDQDCDEQELCYADADADGFSTRGASTETTVVSTDLSCDAAGEATWRDPAGDCDDLDGAIYPTATELVGDEVDQDCNGREVCFVDDDGDGYRTADTTVTMGSLDTDCRDTDEARASEPDGDCDDEDPDRHPGASDPPADGIDQDCDGGDDCFADGDGDGYHDGETTVDSADLDCSDAGELGDPDADGDCDDDNPLRNPGVDELPGDNVDQDCNGTETCFVDADGDGYRRDDVSQVLSEDTDCFDAGEAEATDPGGDCDDDDPTLNPGAEDVPEDGIDQDCDGADAQPPEDDVADGGADVGEGTAAAEDGAGDKSGCGVVGAPASGLVLAWSTVLVWGRRRRETVG